MGPRKTLRPFAGEHGIQSWGSDELDGGSSDLRVAAAPRIGRRTGAYLELLILDYFELAHHVVILVLDVVAVDDVLPPAVLEFHDDPYRLIRPQQDRVLPV